MKLPRWLRGLTLGLSLSLAATPAIAQQAQELLRQGNRALLSGEPEAALRAYDALAESGIADGDLEFNRALAHAEAGRLPWAMVHLERALRLSPGDDGAEQALERVRDELGRRLAQRRGEATVQTRAPLLEALTAPLSSDAFAWSLWLSTLVGSAAWVALLFAKREGLRLGAGVTASVALLLSLIGASGLVIKVGGLREGRDALVVVDELPVREAPDERAPRVTTLDGGTRVRVLETDGSFTLLRAGAKRGWVRARSVATY